MTEIERAVKSVAKMTERTTKANKRIAENIDRVSQGTKKAAENVQAVQAAMEQARANSAAVLQVVKNYRRMSDAALSMRIGGAISRAGVNMYSTGQTVLNVEKMTIFADALKVTPKIFFDTPDQALRWVLDHSPNGDDPTPRDQPEQGSSCIHAHFPPQSEPMFEAAA